MYKRILVALDGSVMAEQALLFAVAHAKCFQSDLFLLRVINPLAKTYRAGSASVSVIRSAEKQLVSMANDYLENVASNLRKNGFQVQIATRIGIPYKEIIQFSVENNIDQLVMCTRGESGITRWMLGSVTDHVIRASTIPVLVIPAKKESKAKR